MIDRLRQFLKSDSGAVTVDWVMLTAMVVGMGLAVMAIFHDGPRNVGQTISARVADHSQFGL